MNEEQAVLGGFVAAGLGPFAVVALLSPLREQPLSRGVVVLLLIVMIASAAVIAGPALGGVATVNAVLSFDFLFVPPFGILKVNVGSDGWTIAVLLAVGGTIVATSRRRWQSSVRRRAAPSTSDPASPPPSRHIQRVVQLIEEGVDPRDLVSAVQVELTSLLLARGCRFEAGPGGAGEDTIARPTFERDGSVSGIGRDVEPLGELELPVRWGSQRVGRFVVDPTPGVSIPFEHRLVAVILTDHLAAAIGSSRKSTPPLT